MTQDHNAEQAHDIPAAIGAPARRALTAAGYTSLAQLSAVSEAELLRLHGMGPRAIGLLREALAAQGLAFAGGAPAALAGSASPAAAKAGEDGAALQSGYAPVNGLQLYYEIHGAGEPLILIHGGLGLGAMFGELLPRLAQGRKVITVDLQAHGRTADIDRPLRYELLGDDIGALIGHLGLGRADLMGYSLGAGVALRTTIQHPELVRKLVVVSAPYATDGWYPDVTVAIGQLSGAMVEFMRPSPPYQAYIAVAPAPDQFATLLDKTGDMGRQSYDWSAEVAMIKAPTLLVFGDADSMPPSHMAAFFGLLGGGKADPGWDGANMPISRLAILPASTHYDIIDSPLVPTVVIPFLDAPMPKA